MKNNKAHFKSLSQIESIKQEIEREYRLDRKLNSLETLKFTLELLLILLFIASAGLYSLTFFLISWGCVLPVLSFILLKEKARKKQIKNKYLI